MHAAFKGTRAHVSPGFHGQILRAVNSIGDNLAEGCAKRSRRALARYADDAYSSSKEVESDLIKARGLGILERLVCEDLLRQSDEVSRLCFGLPAFAPDETMTVGSPTRRSEVRGPRSVPVVEPTTWFRGNRT